MHEMSEFQSVYRYLRAEYTIFQEAYQVLLVDYGGPFDDGDELETNCDNESSR